MSEPNAFELCGEKKSRFFYHNRIIGLKRGFTRVYDFYQQCYSKIRKIAKGTIDELVRASPFMV